MFLLTIYLPWLLNMLPYSYWALTCRAALPTYSAFMISVRQASDLPPASFRFPVTQDTLALGYILPAVGRIRDFHPLKHAPAGRTRKTAAPIFGRDGGFVMQGFSDILPHSETEYHLPLGFFHGRERIQSPMPDAVFLVRQPAGLALLNYHRPLDLPVFNPNCKDISHLITTFSSFSNS